MSFDNTDDILNPVDDNSPEEIHKAIHLTGMYQNWFLDYASYVILERAVPHLDDGLKPVQRRILFTMFRIEDGRYNKVANIIGHAMQFHPHGDASIQDALVQIGQKNLLVDTQGNWGNILTGDSAAAARYIEARLTKFALDVVFNNKTTSWKLSYDGRNKEPITLPVKFPLLLAHGSEGIAVGLASKILPHNFLELIDASIAFLKGKEFELYPDFPTGGYIDVSRYNDGLRGGLVRIRAKINIVDKKTLSITEVPYGKTTGSLIESILKATEKGKIKIRKIDDNTAEFVEILIHLQPGVSPDKTIDALYAFTDCEIPVSPNCCVVDNDSPKFIGVSELLKVSANNTVKLCTLELQIKKNELLEEWHFSSLEKIFFEKKIYRELEKDTDTWDIMIDNIDKAFNPYKKLFKRDITRDDILKLTDKPVRRISKFDIKKADEHITLLEEQLTEVEEKLNNIIPYAINYYQEIKKKYGAGKERLTEIRSFELIQATTVIENNCKLFVNKADGFIGWDLKKDEFVCDCSDIDDIIVFLNDGTYKITKISDKVFVGKNIKHIAVFRKNDERTIYNIIYRDGLNGNIMVKRCAVTGLMRDKVYNITKGAPGSEILYFTANPNGEAEIIHYKLMPKPRLKRLSYDFNFAEIDIKGRNSQGVILTRHAIHKIEQREKLKSTLGGVKIWFDMEVKRLNMDEKGKYLGEFRPDKKIVVLMQDGTFRFTNFDLLNHYDDDLLIIEKFNPKKIYTAVYYDGEHKATYIKRFYLEQVAGQPSFISEHTASKLLSLSENKYPNLEFVFGKDARKDKEKVDADEFIGVKSYKAKGKKFSTHTIKKINELEPLDKPDKPVDIIELDNENTDVPFEIIDTTKEEEENKVEPPKEPGSQMTLDF